MVETLEGTSIHEVNTKDWANRVTKRVQDLILEAGGVTLNQDDWLAFEYPDTFNTSTNFNGLPRQTAYRTVTGNAIPPVMKLKITVDIEVLDQAESSELWDQNKTNRNHWLQRKPQNRPEQSSYVLDRLEKDPHNAVWHLATSTVLQQSEDRPYPRYTLDDAKTVLSEFLEQKTATLHPTELSKLLTKIISAKYNYTHALQDMDKIHAARLALIRSSEQLMATAQTMKTALQTGPGAQTPQGQG